MIENAPRLSISTLFQMLTSSENLGLQESESPYLGDQFSFGHGLWTKRQGEGDGAGV